ncbi:hypothetical protein FK513_31720 [Klebsiella pneumoniae]|nr:hypothetical protein [Klebsiella pneumoniae]
MRHALRLARSPSRLRTYSSLICSARSRLDQMRRLEPLNVKNPPLQQKLNLHCKNSPDGIGGAQKLRGFQEVGAKHFDFRAAAAG